LAPNDPIAWRSLGDCRVQLKQWSAAAASLENAVRLAPEDAGALSKLGLARMQLGDFRGAEVVLHQAIRLSPENGQAARLMLEQIRQQDGR
jgi:cytochrome c-type biogenesis protein CcmH/NrfG